MNWKLHILVFLAFLWIGRLYAQEPYSWQLTDEDGLPSMEVYDLFQDSKKYIWIGTDRGICKYNGQDFQYYKHPQEKGTSATLIQEDGLGRIWYKNFNGQLFYIDQDSIHLFEVPDSIGLNAYSEYLVNEGGIWIGNYDRYYYDFAKKNEWKVYKMPYTKRSKVVELKNKNAIYIKQFYKISKDTLIVNTIQGFALQFVKNKFSKILIRTRLSNDEDYIGFYNYKRDSLLAIVNYDEIKQGDQRELYKIAKDEKETVVFEEEKEIITSNKIRTIFADIEHNVWIINEKGGLQYLANGTTNVLEQKELFPSIPFSSMLQDHEGNYWLGTLDRGVLVFPSKDINLYNKQNSKLAKTKFEKLSSDGENQLFLDHLNGNIGVLKSNIDSFFSIEIPSKKGKNHIVDLFFEKKRNQLFVATIWGVEFIDLTTQKIKKSIANSGYGRMSLYKENNLLLGNNLNTATINIDKPKTNNCAYLDAELCSYYNYDRAVLRDPNSSMRALFRQERTNAVWADQKYPNRFWTGCHDSLFYYQNAKPFVILDEEGKTIQSLDILQTANGVLWVSTINNGVYGIEDHTVKWHYTIKDGLPSNFCNNLTTDGQKLWLSTDKGISYLNPETKEIYTYNKLDGLLTEEIKDLEYLDGKIWVASAKGLMSIDTNYNPINSTVPPIYITGFSINGVDTIVQSTSYELSYAQNSLLIEFEGLSYKSQGKYNYIYRLIGQDSTWIKQPAAAPFVRLEQLRVGTYRFEVKTVNEDGVASEKAAFLVFKINPPFWQTWWFYGLCILTGIGIIVSFVIWRYERIRRQQAIELARIRKQELIENEINELRAEAVESRMQALQSQMNPHFVFNAMTAIQNYWLQNKTSFALRYHAKFAKLMRFIFDYSNKEAITLKKEIEFLELYTTLEQMRFTQPIEVVWDIEEELLDGDYSVPPLLIQPIIENCFKHGFFHKEAAGKLIIKFRKKDTYLYCLVIDDGVGRAQVQKFQKGKKRDANRNSGILVTKQRLAILHKEKIPKIEEPLLIYDLKEKGLVSGTCVELFIPFV